ncbi:MAG: porin family protein [Flavobacteriaceae bacterium]
MKKIILFTVLAIFCFIANAQDVPTSGSDITYGLKGGLNFSMITGDDTDDFDGKFGFHVGGLVEFPISEQFSIQPEIMYSAQGDKMSVDGMDVKLKMDYLTVPVMAKYYVSEGFSLEAGPQLGFLLSAKVEGGGVSVDIKDIIKSIDFGLGFGLGYKLDNGLNFAGRYYVGLSNFVESSGSIMDVPISSDGSKNHNNVFQLSIGYMF